MINDYTESLHRERMLHSLARRRASAQRRIIHTALISYPITRERAARLVAGYDRFVPGWRALDR
jgi:hypothetical protein